MSVDFAAARLNMLDSQVRTNDVPDLAIQDAMAAAPRERFCPPGREYLAYADAQQLRPYSLARWSMTPGQLLRQRLRETLGQRRTLLNPGDGGEIGAGSASDRQRPLTLRIELEEFSQLFTTPDASVGLLRLRASVAQAGPKGETAVRQRSFIVQRSAPSADAAGGVRAMTAATDAVVQELDQWLQSMGP